MRNHAKTRGNYRDHSQAIGRKNGTKTVVEIVSHPTRPGRFFRYMCECGHSAVVSPTDFDHGGRCRKCAVFNSRRKHSQGFVTRMEIQAAFRAINKDFCEKAYSKIVRASGIARSRSMPWEISAEQVVRMAYSPCSYCGINEGFKGLDRKDPSLGYTPENTVPCCYQCNIAKNDWSEDEFKAWAARLSKHLFPVL